MSDEVHAKQTNPIDKWPEAGFVRLIHLIGPGNPIPISRSTLYAWIKDGYFPPPVVLGPRVRAWRVETIRDFITRRPVQIPETASSPTPAEGIQRAKV